MTALEIFLTLSLALAFIILEGYRRLLKASHKRYDELATALDKIIALDKKHE